MPVCRGCGKPVETWRDWFDGDCKVTPAGHTMPREEWMQLPGWESQDKTKVVSDLVPGGATISIDNKKEAS